MDDRGEQAIDDGAVSLNNILGINLPASCETERVGVLTTVAADGRTGF